MPVDIETESLDGEDKTSAAKRLFDKIMQDISMVAAKYPNSGYLGALADGINSLTEKTEVGVAGPMREGIYGGSPGLPGKAGVDLTKLGSQGMPEEDLEAIGKPGPEEAMLAKIKLRKGR